MKQTIKMLVLASMLTAFTGYAQKGIGASRGVSEKGIPLDLIELRGTVKSIKEGPCIYTVGKSISGMHLMITTTEDELINLHLGPTWAVGVWVEGIEGQKIDVVAFRTERLPHNHFIAKEFQWDGQKAKLRDGYLKPFWAGRYGKEAW